MPIQRWRKSASLLKHKAAYHCIDPCVTLVHLKHNCDCHSSSKSQSSFHWGESLVRRAVVIEDSISDLRIAIAALKDLGAEDVEAFIRVDKALLHLRDVVEGNRPAPDLIVLDLNFGVESGFEVLRFRRSNPALSSIPVIVWTVMGDTEQELCRLFGAGVVPKYKGHKALHTVLKSFSAGSGG